MAVSMTFEERRKVELKVILLEVDYHLTCLHDAMKANDPTEVQNQKQILNEKHKELYNRKYFRSEAVNA